jgi:3-oxoacyl-[acyl-carrier protein] reductase
MGGIIIFGASGGIGSALARRIKGKSLLLVGRNEEKLRLLGEELHAPFLSADVTKFEEVDRIFDEAVKQFGEIHGVVNSVGSIILKPAHLTSEAEWHQTLNVNLTSAFAIARSAGRTMTAGGSVVLISTAAARTGLANHDAIAAAKGGILSLVLSAGATYASRGLRFNAVAPGLVATPLSERIVSNEASRKISLAMHALGRLGTPEDIASMIEWLLEPENSWVSGQVFGVDGGLATLRSK